MARVAAADPTLVIHIGPPDTNVHAYVVDERLQLLPPGVPGELLLSGPGLAREYINRWDSRVRGGHHRQSIHVVHRRKASLCVRHVRVDRN